MVLGLYALAWGLGLPRRRAVRAPFGRADGAVVLSTLVKPRNPLRGAELATNSSALSALQNNLLAVVKTLES